MNINTLIDFYELRKCGEYKKAFRDTTFYHYDHNRCDLKTMKDLLLKF